MFQREWHGPPPARSISGIRISTSTAWNPSGGVFWNTANASFPFFARVTDAPCACSSSVTIWALDIVILHH